MKAREMAKHTTIRILAVMAIFGFIVGMGGCFESNSEDPTPSIGDGDPGGGGNGSGSSLTVGDDTLQVGPDLSGKVDVLGNDSGDTLTIDSYDTTSAEQGTVTLNPDNTFTYDPLAGFTGTDSFNYTVKDGQGNTKTGKVTITVNQTVITNGSDLFASKKCTLCHSAGDADTSNAFDASDLVNQTKIDAIKKDMSEYGGQYELMGQFYNLEQNQVDQLKAYFTSLLVQ